MRIIVRHRDKRFSQRERDLIGRDTLTFFILNYHR